MSFHFLLEQDGREIWSREFDGPIEVGRQRPGEAPPISVVAEPTGPRVVVAGMAETTIGRRQMALVPQAGGLLLVKNVSTTVPIRINRSKDLPVGSSEVLPLPATLEVGGRTITLRSTGENGDGGDAALQSLANATLAPGRSLQMLTTRRAEPAPSGELGVDDLLRGLELTLDLLSSSTTPDELFRRAAHAVVKLMGFDFGRVLTVRPNETGRQNEAGRQGEAGRQDDWSVAATLGVDPVSDAFAQSPSRRILHEVRRAKKVVWQNANELFSGESLTHVGVVLAAPILDEGGNVVAVLYGDRSGQAGRPLTPATRRDALVANLLAGAVASGLSRMRLEKDAERLRYQFGQFFSPQLVRQLERQPDLLSGRAVDATMLFCDIRGFSRISEALGPARTFDWIKSVLGELSECVTIRDGVLVDYIGDELMAMWGAPENQPDHAARACAAALDMLSRVPGLNARWLPEVKIPLDVSIGINTGEVRVGNSGTEQKFKYGPLGDNVNLASRVRGATKFLKTRVLATASTVERLGPELGRRRLCDARVVNMQRTIRLFELVAEPSESVQQIHAQYESALRAFEQREFHKAVRILGDLLERRPDDGPSQVLLARAVGAMFAEGETDIVWDLPGK